MLFISLLIVGSALPLAMPWPRAFSLCLIVAAALFAVGFSQGAQGAFVTTAGVFTAGLLIGAVARALLFWGGGAEDRAIRRQLPRELPPRYR